MIECKAKIPCKACQKHRASSNYVAQPFLCRFSGSSQLSSWQKEGKVSRDILYCQHSALEASILIHFIKTSVLNAQLELKEKQCYQEITFIMCVGDCSALTSIPEIALHIRGIFSTLQDSLFVVQVKTQALELLAIAKSSLLSLPVPSTLDMDLN